MPVDRPRIAYVTSRYPHVSHTFVLTEVEQLRETGAEVHTFAVRQTPEEALLSEADTREWRTTEALQPIPLSTLAWSHVTALRTPRTYLASLAATLRRSPTGLRTRLWHLFYFVKGIVLWHHCTRLGIRHLHAHFANVAADNAWVAADFGTRRDPARPWVWSFTMHGPTEFADVAGSNLRQKAMAADLVICISDFCRSQLMALTPQETWTGFRVVHCGIDVARFRPGATKPTDPPIHVLCVGRLVPEKGQALLLKAVADLRADGVAVHLTLAGDGPDRTSLEKLAATLDIEGQVDFLGAVAHDALPSLFQAADVFCLPSFAEGVPVVLMEAMATAVPVITTRIAGIPELVDDGVSGIVTTPGRVSELTAAIRALDGDPDLRVRMGAAGRAKVQAEFDRQGTTAALRSEFVSLESRLV